MANEHLTSSPTGEFVIFASDDGKVRVECRFEQETLWLPQATIANLYQITPQAVTQHIKAIYEEDELDQNATCKSYLQVQQEGRRQQVFLRDWQDKLDQFLQFNDREVLQGAGKVSKLMADEKAQAEYSQYSEQQRRLKEAEGEKDIAALLQWKTEPKK